MLREKYLTVDSVAAICDRHHPKLRFGSTVIICSIKGTRITVREPNTNKTFHLHVKLLHNNFMPY